MSRYIDRDAFAKKQRELYCKDCTRRMGVKNGKLKEIYKIGEVPCKSCELNDALDDLDDYPEADVAPVVHGHWSRLEKNLFEWKYRCSSCNGWTKIATTFCPHCGAKMDAEVKHNEQ